MNPNQLQAIELMCTGDMTQQEVAKQIGVTEQTICVWKRDSKFIELLLVAAREHLKQYLPDIYKTTVKKAKAGSYQHIKLILEHLERIEELRNGNKPGSFTVSWKQ